MNPSVHNQPIYSFSSPYTRAIQVGYIEKKRNKEQFVPGRLNLGVIRQKDTYKATKESLKIPEIQQILSKYKPENISTVTVLRETLGCRLGEALFETGIKTHFGDAYIGATHIKGDGDIRTAYLYENTEGLVPDGLWIIGESFCIGRNLAETMKSLLSKFAPAEILFIAPLASRRAINYVGGIIAEKKSPTSYVAWGGLFGVDEKTLYDMPWGHPDTEPFDERDRQTFLTMYGPALCVGGDFGNNYYSPAIAKRIYEEQLKEHHIIPKIPSVEEIRKIYKEGEILIR
jgi:hypothetical protein